MYLKKLEIVGFKSFMEKTTLNFEPGITAVVGPNGSGKSNIFDAIRWALGEQSVKSLRGSEMQDVIFNGTDTKEPLGMAEASLTFENGKRYFPVEHNDVVITRRIFRSGESEYLLNKTQVRLKDIMDLLMGTGIGAESYSLVEQGKIDLILSSKPEDRRMVFDEASGITRYKTQKKEALRRMEEMEQNLLRVNDIITEVKRQIASLERQANKARKYKETFEELKNKEITFSILQKIEINRRKDEIIKQLEALEAEECSLLVQIAEAEEKINNRQADLKEVEDALMAAKGEILTLDNLASRNNERISFNRERIAELESAKADLNLHIEQAKERIALDEKKLNNLKEEYSKLNENIEAKTALLINKDAELASLNLSTKSSLDNIDKAKMHILDVATRSANVKNEITDLTSKQQIHSARMKRLEIERARVAEEKASVENNLSSLESELKALELDFEESELKISGLKKELENEAAALGAININIDNLEKQKLTLESNKEFLEKLKTKYEDIGESMNAVIYLDRAPADKVSGLVIKIKEFEPAGIKMSGEAKPIDLDTQRITEKISRIEEEIAALHNQKNNKEAHIEALNKSIEEARQGLRSKEMNLVNKRASYQSVFSEANKLREEDEVINIELNDTRQEIAALDTKIIGYQITLADLGDEQKQTEELIANEENKIALNADLKEKVIVAVAQAKTELDALNKRLVSDLSTLELLESSYEHDKERFFSFESQINEAKSKQESLKSEIEDLESEAHEAMMDIEVEKKLLKEAQNQYQQISNSTVEFSRRIESGRKNAGEIKNKLHGLEMQAKDVDFRCLNLKEKILQAYKMDLDTMQDAPQDIDAGSLSAGIDALKEKLDSYGTVNLVAIEEYDELKKRYDFLNQQQADLLSAKESVHELILKINRTTKKMFIDTFEKIGEEFRDYFRMLFNGGDARIFLIDENDPLESGIEIICRPPGKKLQNILLLSGGEKSLSAIALIFAIFKVKPSPFCVLDEIDAALDEANVDRFARTLQEFTQNSQFIVITHNKKTISNADVMYGITMEESGVSKIISVKFTNRSSSETKPSPEPVTAPA